MKIRKLLALLLAVTICGTTLIGCGNKTNNPNDAGTESNDSTEDTPLVIAIEDMSQKFNSILAESVPDQQIAYMCNPELMTLDRAGAIVHNAIEGETREYNGTEYTYQGAADVKVTIDEEYDSTEVADADQVIADIIVQYGSDYVALGNAYAGEEGYFASSAEELANAYLVENSTKEATEVNSIEGIRRMNDYEVEITTRGYDAAAIYQIGGISVMPLHYYGNVDSYDYDNDMFGFT